MIESCDHDRDAACCVSAVGIRTESYTDLLKGIARRTADSPGNFGRAGFFAAVGMRLQSNRTKADAILTPHNSGEDEASLLDILDHVLNAGIVLHGSLVISVAGVDLVYLGLNAILTSVETALKHTERQSLPS